MLTVMQHDCAPTRRPSRLHAIAARGSVIDTGHVAIGQRQIRVIVETGTRRTFACALDFPGWCRSAKDSDSALDALLHVAPRYGQLTRLAGIDLITAIGDQPTVQVVEVLAGNATTDFGAPGQVSRWEADVTEQDIARLTRLHAACAAGFADAAAQAPAQLRKGPRGGGRDTEAVVTHVHQVEHTYATSARRGTWPMAYYLRRSAYHYTDHLWEIQDRSAH